MMMAGPVLATLFQYGRFLPFDVVMASKSLMTLSLGLTCFLGGENFRVCFLCATKYEIPREGGDRRDVVECGFKCAADRRLWLMPVWRWLLRCFDIECGDFVDGVITTKNLCATCRAGETLACGCYSPMASWGLFCGGLIRR